MTWSAGDRWSDRRASLRLLLRFVGAAALCYILAVTGGFSHSLLTGLACVVVVGCLVLTFIDRFSPGWWGVVGGSVLTIVGSTLNAEVSPMGWVAFAIGCVSLIGRDRVRLRLGVPVYLAGAVIIIGIDAMQRTGDWRPTLWTALGTLGVGSMAYIRRQTTQRRRQERELVERSRELEHRSLQLIEQTRLTRAETARAAALEERGRIARDIHDVLAHSLGGLVVQLDAADAVLRSGGDPQDVGERIRTSRRLAVDGLREARHAVRELSRGGPDAEPTEADLAEHVRAAVDGPVGRQLGIDFDVLGEPRAVPESVATAFAAVAREGLTNINKHAPGAAASATLLYSPDAVRLEMINGLRPPQRTEPGGESGARREPPTDDGLDDRTDLSVTGGGYGVAGMSRRMAEVGGRLETERIGDRWQLIADWPAPTAVQHVQADRRSERSGATGTEK